MVGIDLGQGCWGIKGRSRLIGRFWEWERGWGCGTGTQEELEVAARSSLQLWDAVGRDCDEFMAEKSALLLPITPRNGEYLWVEPVGAAPVLGREQPRDEAPWSSAGVSLEVGMLVKGCVGQPVNSASPPKTQHSSWGPLQSAF